PATESASEESAPPLARLAESLEPAPVAEQAIIAIDDSPVPPPVESAVEASPNVEQPNATAEAPPVEPPGALVTELSARALPIEASRPVESVAEASELGASAGPGDSEVVPKSDAPPEAPVETVPAIEHAENGPSTTSASESLSNRLS